MQHCGLSPELYMCQAGAIPVAMSSGPILPHNRSITVLLGAHNISAKEDTWQKIEVEKQFPHPKYDDYSVVHDIMLLKVTSISLLLSPQVPSALSFPCPASGQHSLLSPAGLRTLTFPSLMTYTHLPAHIPKSSPFASQLKEKAKLTLGVGTLPLPAKFNFIPPGRVCRAVGWGKTNVDEPTSDTLQEVKMRLLEADACKHFSSFYHNSQLCVGNPKKMRNVYKVTLILVKKKTILALLRARVLEGRGSEGCQFISV